MEYVHDGDESYSVDHFPSECPLCHRTIDPKEGAARYGVGRDSKYSIDVVFSCPARECRRVFVAHYVGETVGQRGDRRVAKLIGVGPIRPRRPDFPKEVVALSPSFVEIYAQAAAAELYQLSQVAGPGFRKALEFLVKDYCCSRSPHQEAEIKSMQLGSVIARHLGSERVKQSAERAAWLGNDQAHYIQKWSQKDTSDLKVLIRLTVAWIEQELLTERLNEEMPRPENGLR
ncbi:MAG: hypothetical protein SFU84_05280 [Gemmatimonadales bacterium]|nr:hypothetical protein [Gemmatimonadales bacterium]